MTDLRAITLHQPLASLVALKVKTIETRSWAAPKSAIGCHILIHAAQQMAHPDTMDRDDSGPRTNRTGRHE